MKWCLLMIGETILLAVVAATGCQSIATAPRKDSSSVATDPRQKASSDSSVVVGAKTEAAGASSPVDGVQNASASSQNSSRAQQSEPKNLLDVALQPKGEAAQGEVVSSVKAVVNGTPIMEGEVKGSSYNELLTVAHYPEPERTSKQREIYQHHLKGLIEQELLYQKAMTFLKKDKPLLDKLTEESEKEFERVMREPKKHFKNELDFDRYLHHQGTTLDGMRSKHLRRFIADKYMYSAVMVKVDRATGREQIRDYYDRHPEEFQQQDSVTWQDIMVRIDKYPTPQDARRKAEEVANQARLGADFTKLATDKTLNDGPSALRPDGNGTGSRRGDIEPHELEEILFGMRQGEVGRILEVQGNLHVVRVVKRIQAGQVPFHDEHVQLEIKNKLRRAAFDREHTLLIEGLWRKAQVDCPDLNSRR